MPKQPIEFMFSPYRRQVLAALFLRPGEKFHVRELERMTGVSAGSLHRELKAMAESGLLLRKKLGNQVFYQVNADCTIYEELAAIFRKTMGMTSRINGVRVKTSGEIRGHLAYLFVYVSGWTAVCERTLARKRMRHRKLRTSRSARL
jgi:hypothetical protein